MARSAAGVLLLYLSASLKEFRAGTFPAELAVDRIEPPHSRQDPFCLFDAVSPQFGAAGVEFLRDPGAEPGKIDLAPRGREFRGDGAGGEEHVVFRGEFPCRVDAP